jgi:hypothetical protein
MIAEKVIDPELGNKFFFVESKRAIVMRYLQDYPGVTNAGLRFKFPDIKPSTLANYRREFKMMDNIDGYSAFYIRKWLRDLFSVLHRKTRPIKKLSEEEDESILRLEGFLRGEKL